MLHYKITLHYFYERVPGKPRFNVTGTGIPIPNLAQNIEIEPGSKFCQSLCLAQKGPVVPGTIQSICARHQNPAKTSPRIKTEKYLALLSKYQVSSPV
ncbi:hypothetical protein AS034_17590 [[Bacillus] enclensis]|nr:hypothetical protein AS034_17590 [[Bacillus] enclensis]